MGGSFAAVLLDRFAGVSCITLARLFLLAIIVVDAALGQGAQMVGGRPPNSVERQLCEISTVFAKLTEIKNNPECTAGCAGGECPPDWYPGAQ